MTRRPRFLRPGAIYHVVSRGVDRRDIFRDDQDYRRFRDSLFRIVAASDAELLAYCLMPNHFHLVIRTGDRPLSAIMQELLTSHACFFNLRHHRTGHLFESRFYSDPIVGDIQLLNTIRYVHQNPVKAKLVERAADWPWSSATGPEDDIPLPEDFVLRGELVERLQPQLSLDSIAAIAEQRFKVPISLIKTAGRVEAVLLARRFMASESVRTGHKRSEIAAWLNTTEMSISRYLRA